MLINSTASSLHHSPHPTLRNSRAYPIPPQSQTVVALQSSPLLLGGELHRQNLGHRRERANRALSPEAYSTVQTWWSFLNTAQPWRKAWASFPLDLCYQPGLGGVEGRGGSRLSLGVSLENPLDFPLLRSHSEGQPANLTTFFPR